MNEDPHRIVADAAGVEAVDQFQQQQFTEPPKSFQLGNSPLECAPQYLARGWWVLPLHSIRDGRCSCGKFDCPSPGKHPRVKRGFKDASNDPAQIEAWRRKWPDANIGIATGASSLVVIDVDGDEGQAELKALIERYGVLPRTLVAKTGRRGGLHFYFSGSGVPSSQEKGRYIDIRGSTGYVVASPSNHASGQDYAWIDAMVPIAPFPEWAKVLTTNSNRGSKERERAGNRSAHQPPANDTADGLGLGSRPDWLG